MSKKLVIFSFFSGSGFLDLGFENNGFQVDLVNEFQPAFLKAYQYSRAAMGSENKLWILQYRYN